jgi:hypothetical protein
MKKHINKEEEVKEYLTESEMIEMLEKQGIFLDLDVNNLSTTRKIKGTFVSLKTMSVDNTSQAFLRALNEAAKIGAETRQKEIVQRLEKMSFYSFGQELEIESAKEMTRDDIVDEIKTMA